MSQTVLHTCHGGTACCPACTTCGLLLRYPRRYDEPGSLIPAFWMGTFAELHSLHRHFLAGTSLLQLRLTINHTLVGQHKYAPAHAVGRRLTLRFPVAECLGHAEGPFKCVDFSLSFASPCFDCLPPTPGSRDLRLSPGLELQSQAGGKPRVRRMHL